MYVNQACRFFEPIKYLEALADRSLKRLLEIFVYYFKIRHNHVIFLMQFKKK